MLECVWLASILAFIGGWAALWLSPGSQLAGLAVYAATVALLGVALAGLVRLLRVGTRHLRS